MAGWMEVHRVVRDHLAATWILGQDPPVLFTNGGTLDNVPFKAPTSGPWLFVDVVWNGSGAGAIDGSRSRKLGRLWIIAFSPVGTGLGDVEALAARASDLFAEKDIEGIIFEDSAPGGDASADDVGIKGAWFGRAVTIPFTIDHQRA